MRALRNWPEALWWRFVSADPVLLSLLLGAASNWYRVTTTDAARVICLVMYRARAGPVRDGGRPARRYRPYHEATDSEANLVRIKTLIQEHLARL
jgi:hypothetical protein